MSELRKRESVAGERPGAGDPEELDDALSELDRITRELAGSVTDLTGPDHAGPEPTEGPIGIEDYDSGPSDPEGGSGGSQRASRVEMDAAAAEAEVYLQRAKARADRLVQTVLAAVEDESEKIRRDARARIEARWAAAEREAQRQVEHARQISERMVAERQQRIAALSDEVTAGADELTVGMKDAAEVKAQFDQFVRTLALTADRIARSSNRRRPRPAPAPEAVTGAGFRDDEATAA